MFITVGTAFDDPAFTIGPFPTFVDAEVYGNWFYDNDDYSIVIVNSPEVAADM